MEVLKFPHPSLFKPCKEVTVFDRELRVLLDSMWETMKANNGVGLAANQVGLPWRMFVMQDHDGTRLNMVNPVINRKSSAPANLKEGCLSAPGEFIVIPDRVAWVEVLYRNEQGDSRRAVLGGIFGVCAQHEIEHLDGKGFMENRGIPKARRKVLASKWGFKLK